jgi:hypothetical protein
MNEANYASLEASKRLVAAGIVLETEAHWWQAHKQIDWILQYKNIGLGDMLKLSVNCIPAPSMAEVWRELPERSYFTKYNGHYQAWSEWTTFEGHGDSSPVKENTNPTDALIDLLILVKKEAV